MTEIYLASSTLSNLIIWLQCIFSSAESCTEGRLDSVAILQYKINYLISTIQDKLDEYKSIKKPYRLTMVQLYAYLRNNSSYCCQIVFFFQLFSFCHNCTLLQQPTRHTRLSWDLNIFWMNKHNHNDKNHLKHKTTMAMHGGGLMAYTGAWIPCAE